MAANRRLLVLGIDSIDWLLVKQWAADGRLPVLQRLIDASRVLHFGESNRPLPGSIWTDIATGVSAGIHGFVHEEQLARGSYRFERVDSSRVAVPPFYKYLDDAGVRCAVVDFPVDYPMRNFKGIQVVDWATEFKLWRFATVPAHLAAELELRYGRHPLTNYPGTRPGLAELLALKRKLHDGIDIKQRFASDLLARREHDFIFFNFAELHKAGHFFWCFHDRTHPEFTAVEPELVDSLRAMYEHLDRAVGKVLEGLSDNDDLIVITDRGMYADHRGDHLVDAALLKLGLAAPRGKTNERRQSRTSWVRRAIGGKKARQCYRYVGRQLLPEALRDALSPLHRAAIGELPPFDWKHTRVFRLPSVGNSYLRVNLAGREPQGIVAPGDEYDAVLGEIAARFGALVNPETGEPAVEGVYFPATQFTGPLAQGLPDAAVLWNAKAPINSITSPEIGVIEGRQISDRTGNHRPEGFALLHGPAFAGGPASSNVDARTIAPFVTEYFGVAMPAISETESGVRVAGADRYRVVLDA